MKTLFKKHETLTAVIIAFVIGALLFGGIYAGAQTLGPARTSGATLYKSDGTEVAYHPAGASPADNESNTNTALSRIGVFNFVFDGTAWDRWTGAVNVSQFGGNNVVTGTGAGGSGIPRVTISNDSSLAANQSVNVAQINGVTPLMGNGASGTGAHRVTIANDSTGIIQPVPGTTGGLSSCVVQSAASTNATNCKNAAGQLYHVQVINTTSTIYYLRLYNLSTSPTCSSATGFIRSIPIPHANGAGAGIAANQHPGEAFGTGIGFCLTGGGSSTDNTNAATGVYITLLYK
jgi:hypothetical protein